LKPPQRNRPPTRAELRRRDLRQESAVSAVGVFFAALLVVLDVALIVAEVAAARALHVEDYVAADRYLTVGSWLIAAVCPVGLVFVAIRWYVIRRWGA
jgi:hypothetical protein